MRAMVGCVVFAFVGLGLTACGAQSPDQDGESSAATPLGEFTALANSDRVLEPGLAGEDVRGANRYFFEYGYLPNADLAQRFPQWRSPVSSAPESEDVFDEASAAATRAFQRNVALPETGVVDAATRAMMLTPRCGVPEIARLDASDKYDPGGASDWNKTNLTWRYVNTVNGSGVNEATGGAIIQTALAQWAPTHHTFTRLTSGVPDILISFSATNGNGQPWGQSITLAETKPIASGGDIYLNANKSWSTTATTPSTKFDFESVVVHELGHALGIEHTSITAPYVSGTETPATQKPIMVPSLSAGLQRRTARPDDIVSAIVRSQVRWTGYDFDPTTIDIDVDNGSNFYDIFELAGPPAPGGSTVWLLHNNDPWTTLPGQGAVRVSSNGGSPWIVQDDGDIFQWQGSWVQRPGCATDIGVGGDFSVWIIECGGFPFKKWNGSAFVADSAGILGFGTTGLRISVGPLYPAVNSPNVPWVVSAAGPIYRRTSNSTSTGSWALLPGGGAGKDIAVSANGYTWLIGTDTRPGGHSIYAWVEQNPSGDGFPTPVDRHEWRYVGGEATNIATTNTGLPYVIDSNGTAYSGY